VRITYLEEKYVVTIVKLGQFVELIELGFRV
jgi:hypothetical protein